MRLIFSNHPHQPYQTNPDIQHQGRQIGYFGDLGTLRISSNINSNCFVCSTQFWINVEIDTKVDFSLKQNGLKQSLRKFKIYLLILKICTQNYYLFSLPNTGSEITLMCFKGSM